MKEQERRHDEERLHDENHDKQAGDLAQRLPREARRDVARARCRRFARILAPAT